ncbi:MAG: hypothetical protein JNM27_21300 [Leptospirales bacterium]|nr:hypothetical protein [Leptospirales bacterium]
MTASEFKKMVPATGILGRLLGQKKANYALGVSLAPTAPEAIASEMTLTASALADWTSKRGADAAMIMITVMSQPEIATLIKIELQKLKSSLPALASIPMEFNSKAADGKMQAAMI